MSSETDLITMHLSWKCAEEEIWASIALTEKSQCLPAYMELFVRCMRAANWTDNQIIEGMHEAIKYICNEPSALDER